MYGALVVATEIIAPSDARTGIPLPIISNYEPPAVGRSLQADEVVADWHHPFHPRATLVAGGAGEIALRNSRIQWVNREEHNAYHKVFEGPALPKGNELLRTVIFASAGHIPERGLCMHGENVMLQKIPNEYREYLWRSRQIKVANTNVVRDYLLEQAFGEQDFGGINTRTIDEFLHTKDRTRRIELGNTLLGLAVYDTTASLRLAYKSSRRRELLPPSSPRTVGRCALKIVTRPNRSYTLGLLEKRLQGVA